MQKMIGNSNATRKLTAEDVAAIRTINKRGREQIAMIRSWSTAKAIADKFGVHPRNIEKIINYETWRHVV